MKPIARISYANTDPFFFNWPEEKFPFVAGAPRELADAARAGRISAGPLPLVECWGLENDFEPLGSWGIAARDACRSVLLLSDRPMSELNGVTVGLTTDSSTSVLLFETLIRAKYGHSVALRRGFEETDVARVVIGDSALRIWNERPSRWPVITDLATEWWDWKKLPFVFARWVVRRDLPSAMKSALREQVGQSLRGGLENLTTISEQRAGSMGLSADAVRSYLLGIRYALTPDDERGAESFRQTVQRDAALVSARN